MNFRTSLFRFVLGPLLLASAVALPAQQDGPQTDPRAPRPAGYVPWEAFPAHVVGAKVQYHFVAGRWKPGTIREVGGPGASFANKYLVVDDGHGGTDYQYYKDVAGTERRDFWTGWFVGQWALGSGMAITPQREGGGSRNEVLYVGASETLDVKADGTFVWTDADRKKVRGEWEALLGTPGIVVRAGLGGRDYVMFNATDNATVEIMKEHHARLATPGQMSTLARRKIPAVR